MPNVDPVARRLSLVRGATADRDLLFVEWGTPAGDAGQRLVSSYRRDRAERKSPGAKG